MAFCACTACYYDPACSSTGSWRTSCVGCTLIPSASSWGHLAPGRQCAYEPPISCWDRNAKLGVHALSSPCSPGSPAHCTPRWSQQRARVGRSDASSGWGLSNNSEFQSYCWGAFIQSSKHSEAHLRFLLGLLCKFDFQMNLHSQGYLQSMSTPGCAINIASQTVKSLKRLDDVYMIS